MNNDFSINIGIKLEDSNLSNELRTLQAKINNDPNGNIKLKIDFGSSITESLKSISNMSTQLQNLNKQTQNINNTKITINTNDLVSNIKKTLDNVSDLRKDLSSFGKVTINSDDINKVDNKMKDLTATVEIAGQKIKLLYNAIKQPNGKDGETIVTGYEFNKIKSVTDGTDKIIKDLQKFKKEFQQELNDINNTGFADKDILKGLQTEINNLNPSNFKNKTTEIKNNLKELSIQAKNTQENFNNILGFQGNQQEKINKLFSNDILPKDKILNIEAKITGLNGNESQDYIKSLQVEMNKLIQEEEQLTQENKNYKDSIKQTYNENGKLLDSLYTKEERLKNIRNSYSGKLDVNSDGFNKLETEYNSIIQKVNEYKERGTQLTNTESQGITSRINKLVNEKNEIINIINFMKQQENVLNNLENKYKRVIDVFEVNNIKNKLNGLGNSTNIVDDKNDITKQVAELETLAKESQRLANLGKVVGTTGSNINMGSSTREIEQFLKSTVSYKAKISSINEEIDTMGNRIKTVNYSISNGNQMNKFKMSIDESSGSVRNLNQGMADLSSRHATFSQRIKDSVDGLIRFSISATLMFQSIQQVKNVVQYVTDLDTAITDLSKVVDFSKNTLSQMSDEAVKMGKNLGFSSLEISKGFAETGRFLKDKEEIIAFTKAATVAAGVTDMTVAESSKALSTALISFKLNAKDVMSVVDQMNELQNSYRVTANDLAEGIGTVGSAANEAGIKIQDLEGYLTAMIASTGVSGGEAGTAIKTVVARMFRIGKDGEEDAGKTEEVLNKYGVAIRDSSQKYKAFTEIMDNVSKKIQQLQKDGNSYAVQEITQTMGGQYQYSKLIGLINNYSMAKEATAKAYNSENSAMDENAKRMDSIQGRLGVLKATTEEFYKGLLEGDTIKSTVSGLTQFVSVLQSLTSVSKSSLVEILALSAGMVLLIKNASGIMAFTQLIIQAQGLSGVLGVLSASTVGLQGSFLKLFNTMKLLLLTPQGLIFAALATAVGLATYKIIEHTKHQADLKAQTDSLKKSYDSLNESMKSNNTDGIKTSSGDIEKTQKTLQDALKQKKALEDELNNPVNNYDVRTNNMVKDANTSKLADVNKVIQEQSKVLKDAGLQYNETTGEIYKLGEAQNQLNNNEIANKIKQDTEAQINHNNQLVSLIQEYQDLNSVEEKNATQKLRMSQLSNELSGSIKELTTTRDADGNVIIQNSNLLGKNIDMLNDENKNLQTNANAQMEASKQKATWQINETSMTYAEIKKRIQMYNQEAIAAQAAAQQAAQTLGVNPEFTNGMGISTAVINQQMPQLTNAISSLDKIYGSATSSIGKTTSALSDGYKPATDDAKKSTDAYKEAVQGAKDITKDFDTALKNLDNTLYAHETVLQSLDDSSESYRQGLKTEIELLEQKNTTLDQGITLAKNSINSLGGSNTVTTLGGSLGNQIVNNAEKHLNTPYVTGGESLSEGGFDCSGLVQFVAKQAGISLSRTSQEQFKQGSPVSKANLQPGDLVFFKSGGSADAPGHVGIYAGDGNYIHSPKTGDVVKTSSLDGRSDYVGARRIVDSSNATTSNNANGQWTGKYSSWINDAASKNGLDPLLIASMIQQESSFNPKAYNKSSGATGLGQFLASTAQEVGLQNREDPQSSIYAMAKYLKQRINQSGGDTWAGVRGYGEGTTEYENLIKGWYSKFSGGQTVGGSNSAVTEVNSLESKIESYEKEKIDVAKKIEELKVAILTSEIKQYDNQISLKDKSISDTRSNADLYGEGSTQKTEYLTDESKIINEKYGILSQKEQALNNAINSGKYSEKTIVDLKNQLAEVQSQELSTIKELHDTFSSMWQAMYNQQIKPIDDELSKLENQQQILDLVSQKGYEQKIQLNQQIVKQEDLKKTKIEEQIAKIQNFINIEKYDTTRQLLLKQLQDYNKELDATIQKEIQAQKQLQELAKNQALEQIKKGLYDGETQQDFEDGINSKISFLDDELETMNKQNEALQEKEERQKNLLSLAEAQKKLQDEMNNKSVQQLTKDKNGNYQFKYVANQQNVDSAEQTVRNQIQSNSDWERQNELKHRQDEINEKKRLLQQEISLRQEAYSRIQNDIDTAMNEDSALFSQGGMDINAIVQKSFESLSELYNGKYVDILNTAQEFISQYAEILGMSSEEINNAQKKITSLGSSSTTSTNSSNSSSGNKIINSYSNSSGSYQVYSNGDIVKLDTGGETGDWSSNDGKVAMLHKKERVLDQSQTLSFNDLVFNQMPVIQELLSNLKSLNFDNLVLPNILQNIKLPDFSGIGNQQQTQTVNQTIQSIQLNCPNVTDGDSLIETLKTLPQKALQFVNSNILSTNR